MHILHQYSPWLHFNAPKLDLIYLNLLHMIHLNDILHVTTFSYLSQSFHCDRVPMYVMVPLVCHEFKLFNHFTISVSQNLFSTEERNYTYYE